MWAIGMAVASSHANLDPRGDVSMFSFAPTEVKLPHGNGPEPRSNAPPGPVDIEHMIPLTHFSIACDRIEESEP